MPRLAGWSARPRAAAAAAAAAATASRPPGLSWPRASWSAFFIKRASAGCPLPALLPARLFSPDSDDVSTDAARGRHAAEAPPQGLLARARPPSAARLSTGFVGRPSPLLPGRLPSRLPPTSASPPPCGTSPSLPRLRRRTSLPGQLAAVALRAPLSPSSGVSSSDPDADAPSSWCSPPCIQVLK